MNLAEQYYSIPAESELVCFSAEQIPAVWDHVKRHIQRGLERGSRWTLGECYDQLCSEGMQLWTSVDDDDEIEAALVTKIDGPTCVLIACGGRNMDEWVRWFPIVETWAKEQGCKELVIRGRIAWARVLGLTVTYTHMVKQL